ncbi:MAG: hypothetical protein A2504_04430 [Bdellovibrionales bacterium RIFOXYD12_FULL_39_22]|nr:MAG: hypothetical protein A2385_07395 [Bdellovibrionales bacterium RIFOXYB1_FULL_39_21]OFZ42085.1 MAG: hypothetical protein A2485_09365 [Bdellovibrionales bacterium RIFOXYC12_FULL_39_17]OFZ50801.1 MAG: hypothetical protein A2404_06315 [Bdellovibrionales bacterium RIFOXYC1_FULL_39_130]OFZ78024.1 MAG: hypothetical protein A2560_01485 [Bdellovibrionales bacterium RIFOXYD1_FULL_39_84]OFZ93540.1 MAG: hypothetical protein A2504_04430 [Bdellovibrionales bacterium RIFOXYD12_FULL_39_22]HLE10337.1 FK
MLVTIEYLVKDQSGTTLFDTGPDHPFTTPLGIGVFPAKIEAELRSIEVGTTKEITLTPQEGYGIFRDYLVQNISKEIFPSEINLAMGSLLELATEDGPTVAKIIQVNPHDVVVDANHPWAGKTIIFFIKLLERNNSEFKCAGCGHSGNNCC